jgi:Flp pilus assembly protein TadG
MKTRQALFSMLFRLAKERRGRIHRLLAQLWRDEDGSWIILTSLLMPILVSVAGLGTEGALLLYQHRCLQSAADAAAYSAAISYSYSTSADITTQAQAVVASYGYALGTGTDQANVAASATTVSTSSGGTLPAVQVTISRPQSAIFSSIYFPTLPNSVSATAVLSSSNTGNCLLALGNQTANGNTTSNAPNAIHVQGNANLDIGGCGIFSDSTADCSDASVTIQGTGSLLAGSFGTAGCATSNGSQPAQIGPPPNAFTEFDGALSDPYLRNPLIS